MQLSLPRRHFLHTACGLAAGAWASQLGGPWQAGSLAAEPIERQGAARFKFSLAAYSYRNLLKGAPPELTLSDFIRDCAGFDLEATELTSYYFPQPITAEYLRQLKRECFLLGLDVSGTAVGNDFGHPDETARRQQIQHVKDWCDHAEVLGAPVIRVFAGRVPKDVEPQVLHRWMVDGLQECCDYAAGRGVFLALENHGGPTATADGLLALVRDVNSPWFGVNLDTGNFHTADPYGDLERVASYAVNVQVKVTISGPDKNSQPTDYGRLAAMLRKVGYQGYVVLEYEESGNPRTECGKHLAQIRQAFA
ncbi:MAG: sugar phosphate isomerase/epimerase [Pirellulaceae bacterium]|nr:sugar phosphate isomerase/epimerase [Pirellulaceae bacterium]